MKYASYQYLWPPRPEKAIPVTAVGPYQRLGWWAQIKKNGTYTMVYARGLEVIFKTRHGQDNDGNHKQWSPLQDHVRFFQSSSTEWNVYCTELLHSKTTHIKNQIYIFDQIVKDGVQLVGTTFASRQQMLHKHFDTDNAKYEGDQYRLNPYISVAKTFDSGFRELVAKLKPEDEGLVFKNPMGKLAACLKPNSNASWQVKARIPHKNYSF